MDLFIDLSNIYSHLIKSNLGEPKHIRDYFLNWLDFNSLARSFDIVFGEHACNIWIFYSGERIGPSSARIDGTYLRDFIKRLNITAGVTARDVNIPGLQREKILYKCKNCGADHEGEWKSEKGVDAALTVHLFDTMESWDKALLLSCDADFVPTVASLRRRGKVVAGAGFPNASYALIRECYNYYDLMEFYLTKDLISYRFFSKNGIVRNAFYNHEKNLESQAKNLIGPAITFEVSNNRDLFTLSISDHYDITFLKNELEDIENRLKKRLEIEQVKKPHPMTHREITMNCIEIGSADLSIGSVRRKFPELTSSLECIEGINGGGKSFYIVR